MRNLVLACATFWLGVAFAGLLSPGDGPQQPENITVIIRDKAEKCSPGPFHAEQERMLQERINAFEYELDDLNKKRGKYARMNPEERAAEKERLLAEILRLYFERRQARGETFGWDPELSDSTKLVYRQVCYEK